MTYRIATINPGSTSTEVGLFSDQKCIARTSVDHNDTPGPVLDELPARWDVVHRFVSEHAPESQQVDAVAARGGLLPPLPAGTYRIDDELLELSRSSPRGEHASNLGALLARKLADHLEIDACFVVDPVSVDEMDDVARISGLDGIERQSLCHALNIRAVAYRFARKHQIPFVKLRLIVAHLGTGVSIAVIRDGRLVDVINPRDEGPMGLDRPGAVPNHALLDLMEHPEMSRADIERQLLGNGGIYSYLGTRDLREVLKMRAQDEQADLLYRALIYDTARWIGAASTALCGYIDAIVLTGGMAHSEQFCQQLCRRIDWIAPTACFPGSDESQALADGALRVLKGRQNARQICEILDSSKLRKTP